MTPILHICIDLETAALGERAAILSVAAVPFLLPSDYPAREADSHEGKALASHYREINASLAHIAPYASFINATSCVLAGMDFDPDTVRFWHDQPDAAKLPFADAEYVTLRAAFEQLISWINGLKHELECDVRIWSQGTDFDIPKLRYVCTQVLGISERKLPWRHDQVCDARTYVLEGLAMLFGRKEGNKAIYADIPQPEGVTWEKHTALGDAQRTAYNVVTVNRMLAESLSLPTAPYDAYIPGASATGSAAVGA